MIKLNNSVLLKEHSNEMASNILLYSQISALFSHHQISFCPEEGENKHRDQLPDTTQRMRDVETRISQGSGNPLTEEASLAKSHSIEGYGA